MLRYVTYITGFVTYRTIITYHFIARKCKKVLVSNSLPLPLRKYLLPILYYIGYDGCESCAITQLLSTLHY